MTQTELETKSAAVVAIYLAAERRKAERKAKSIVRADLTRQYNRAMQVLSIPKATSAS